MSIKNAGPLPFSVTRKLELLGHHLYVCEGSPRYHFVAILVGQCMPAGHMRLVSELVETPRNVVAETVNGLVVSSAQLLQDPSRRRPIYRTSIGVSTRKDCTQPGFFSEYFSRRVSQNLKVGRAFGHIASRPASTDMDICPSGGKRLAHGLAAIRVSFRFRD